MQHMGSQNRCFNAAFRPPTAFKLLFPDVNFGFPSLLIISFYSCSQSVRGVTLSLSPVAFIIPLQTKTGHFEGPEGSETPSFL